MKYSTGVQDYNLKLSYQQRFPGCYLLTQSCYAIHHIVSLMWQGETVLLLHSHHPPPSQTQRHPTPLAHPVYYPHYLVTRLNCLQAYCLH